MTRTMTRTMPRRMTWTLFNDLELDSTSGAWPQLHRGCLQTISFFPWPVCDASVKSAVISTKIQRESPVAESGHSRLGQSLKRGARPFPPVLTWGEDFDWWQWCWLVLVVFVTVVFYLYCVLIVHQQLAFWADTLLSWWAPSRKMKSLPPFPNHLERPGWVVWGEGGAPDAGGVGHAEVARGEGGAGGEALLVTKWRWRWWIYENHENHKMHELLNSFKVQNVECMKNGGKILFTKLWLCWWGWWWSGTWMVGRSATMVKISNSRFLIFLYLSTLWDLFIHTLRSWLLPFFVPSRHSRIFIVVLFTVD